MSFLTIATPFIRLGIRVFPLWPGTKIPPANFHFLEEATTDPAKVAAWDAQNSDCNVALLANDKFCFLEFDIARGLSKAAGEMEQITPITRSQKSGCGFGHYIFLHTDRSRALGNRTANLPDGGEWFSFRADRKYLVGAGSRHPNGSLYQTVRDIEPTMIPDWLCDFIEKHSTPSNPPTCDEAIAVSDDFDFDDMMDFYGISGSWDDDWYLVDECPVAEYRHSHSTRTGFFYDGNSLGWNCFAQECPGSQMKIGQVISTLNATKGSPYRGIIWDHEVALIDSKWEVENLDEVDRQPPTPEPTPTRAPSERVVERRDNYTDGIEEMLKEQKLDGEVAWEKEDFQPAPVSVAVTDPENHDGLEFPGGCAMYGRLGTIAERHERLQLGWLYPSLLIVASSLDTEDADHHVRANEYGALLGAVHSGKNIHMDAALKSIQIPKKEEVVLEDAPGSHSGLMNQLSEDEPVHRLLFLDELINVFNACAIQGSNLPSMLCTLWDKDKTGGSVKKGRQVVYGKLSILGGLAINDISDFARVFGSHTVRGLYDRFIFGYSTSQVRYRPSRTIAENFDLKPLHFPDWVWEVKDQWIGDDLSRGRLSQHALRIALITAACNGDTEITAPCLEAAFRFCEWQQRLRQVFKPGLAETKDAEAFEAAWTALKEQFKSQKKSSQVHPKAELLTLEMNQAERWKLIHFTDVMNSKSYYRTYSSMIGRVRKTLVEEGFIGEVREVEEDGKGGTKKSKAKTPFVILLKEVK
jgi:hypothetical protein